MHLRDHTFLFSLALVFLLSACRDAPELPPIPKDTEVNVRVTGDPTGLNFLLNYDDTATKVMRLLSLPFLDFNPNTYKIEPVLAKSLPVIEEVSEGKYKGLLAYQYEILEEAVWDDGTPITGKDALFTLKATYNPNYRSPYPSYFVFIKALEVNLENPKQFTVFAQKYLIGDAIIGNNIVPMPAHLLDPNGVYDNYSLADLQDPKKKEKIAADAQLKAVGALFQSPKNMGQEGEMGSSGPYKLTSWVAGQSLTLEKKDSWWGNQLKRTSIAANPKKITFKIVPDFNAARSLFLNGELDVMGNIGIGDFESLKKNDFFKENYNFYAPSRFAHRTIIMNMTNPKLSDKKVRRALAYLLDLEEVFDVVYMGEKNYVTSIIHPTKPYYNKELKPIVYNVDKAKDLLETSGWTDSNGNGIVDKMIDGQLQEMNLRISFSARFNDWNTIAQIFQDGAKRAGVNLELVPLDSRPLQLGWKQKDYDLSFWPSSWYPLHKNLRQKWHSESSSNYTGFGTVESDRIINEIDQTTDEKEIAKLYTEFQRVFYEEQPVIMINTASHHIITSKKFGDITVTAMSPGYSLNQLKQVAVPASFSKN